MDELIGKQITAVVITTTTPIRTVTSRSSSSSLLPPPPRSKSSTVVLQQQQQLSTSTNNNTNNNNNNIQGEGTEQQQQYDCDNDITSTTGDDEEDRMVEAVPIVDIPLQGGLPSATPLRVRTASTVSTASSARFAGSSTIPSAPPSGDSIASYLSIASSSHKSFIGGGGSGGGMNNNNNHNNNNGIGTTLKKSSNGNNNTPSSPASMASQGPPPGGAAAAAAAARFKLILLILMVLQNSSTVLVGRYTRTKSDTVTEDDLYNVGHLIMITELSKLVLSFLLEYGSTWSLTITIAAVKTHCYDHAIDALKVSIPALLYLVQNTLLYVALGNLTAPIFQVTYQAKLVTTAIVSVILLNRSYVLRQWVCLILLSIGVAIVVLGEQKDGGKAKTTTETNNVNLFVGLTAVTVACFSSALAGVYFEMVLKKKAAPVPTTDANGGTVTKEKAVPEPSLWVRNIQLSFFTIVVIVVQGFSKSLQSSSSSGSAALVNTKPYLHGFTLWVWILVLLQAGGGLLVAAVIKYADNVLKGLATGVSVVFATSVSVVLFNTSVTNQFLVGAILILGSVYYFSNPLPSTLTTSHRIGLSKQEKRTLLPK